MEQLQVVLSNWGVIVVGLAAVAGVVGQFLAIFGKPKWAERVKAVSEILDKIGGNYGKAKNK
jgi:hypothetical protein